MQKDICYWCGGLPTSREHVPPLAIFPPGKRIDLITVPSCDAHNKNTSKLDEKFRFYLQSCADSEVARDDFASRTVKGLRREKSLGFAKGLAAGSFQVTLPTGEKTIALKVSPQEQEEFFEKIVRGLYYHLYRKSTDGRVASFSTVFVNPGFDYNRIFQMLGHHLTDPNIMTNFPTKNPDVFQFKYALAQQNGCEGFCVVMLFYKSIEVIGLISPKAQ